MPRWFLIPALVLALTASAWAQTAGAVPISKEEYQRQPSWAAGFAQPGRAQVDLRPFMPPVGNQGGQPSCTAWAVAYACGSFYQGIRRGRKPVRPDDQMSPAFLYNQVKERGGGSAIHKALLAWRKQGVATLESMPHTDRNDTRLPNAQQNYVAGEFRIMGYGKIANRDTIRTALSLMYPVVINMQTTKAFLYRRWPVYSTAVHKASGPPGGKHAFHAMCLVGFDDGRRAFLVQNSWGPKWGQGGYAWLSYDLFERVGPGNVIWSAWVVERARGVHQKAMDRLAAPKSHIKNVELTVLAWDDEGRYRWKVMVDAYGNAGRAVEVTYSWTDLQGRPRRHVSRKADREHVFSTVEKRPGVFVLTAQIRFKNGSTGTIRRRVLLFRGQ